MRVRINRIELIGGGRELEFRPGLNIIRGETTSGKTTLVRLIRGLFGGSYEDLIPEVRQHVSQVQGNITLGSASFTVVRPATAAEGAKVDIASDKFALRLPVRGPGTIANQTYDEWLRQMLGLPQVEIPVSKSPDVPFSPVTINDWFLYCHLKWQEIDTMVMGHHHPFKDQKRRVVFGLLYRLYDPEVLQLRSELRDLQVQIHRSREQSNLLEATFAGTPFANRAELARQLEQTQARLRTVEEAVVNETNHARSTTTEPGAMPQTRLLRQRILHLDRESARLTTAIPDEEQAAEGLQELIRQLQAQNRRIAKSIVANSFLLDFDFYLCPRCGAEVSPERAPTEHCYLCLQQPSPSLTRSDLVREQGRLDAQIHETQTLIQAHENAASVMRETLEQATRERSRLAAELDYQTRAYISDHAERLQLQAAERATLLADIKRLGDYLEIHDRLQESRSHREQLLAQANAVKARLDELSQRESESATWLHHLNDVFRATLSVFDAPHIGDSHETYIDPRTYLPVFDGRTFETLSSPGLIVQINVAHALAHHLTSLEFGLKLPAVLLIDGFTSNLANRGLARSRKDRMYRYLISLSSEIRDQFQVIVADDDVPDWAGEYVRVELTEQDRLIRISSEQASYNPARTPQNTRLG